MMNHVIVSGLHTDFFLINTVERNPIAGVNYLKQVLWICRIEETQYKLIVEASIIIVLRQ